MLSRSPMKDLVVKELTPSLRDDFLLFFDTVAFADNPEWSDCYCSAYHFTNNTGKAESRREDRKSTRLNSSHLVISYAVFCLKKKITDMPFYPDRQPF